MESRNFYLGADVSKSWFDVSVMSEQKRERSEMDTARFDNTPEGMKKFEKWLSKHKVSYDNRSLLVIENTGVYHRPLWGFCSRKGLPIHIGNAAHIKWSFGIARGKNDKIDSQRLCRHAFKEAESLKAAAPLNPVLLALNDYMTARTKLLTQLNSIRAHIRELEHIRDFAVPGLKAAYESGMAGIKESILNMDREIDAIVSSDPGISNNYDLLRSVPGIGRLTAVYLVCCTNNFISKIKGKQLACYAGVVPFEHSSGSSIKGKARVHQMANKDLKRLLHLSALAAISHYPEFKQYYDRKKAEGKHSMSVINAIRNKIVLRAAAVINNQTPYAQPTSLVA